MKGKHIGIIFITLCYIMVNSSYNLPYKLIINNFMDIWLKNK